MSMPNIFVKREDRFFVGFIPFGRFGNLSVIMGGYIVIYCHGVVCKRVTVLYSKAHPSPPRAILTPARVGQYYGHTHIYIPPYAIPPTTLTPGSKVRGHRVTGLGSHRVTRSPGSQGYLGHHGLGSPGLLGHHGRLSHLYGLSMISGHLTHQDHHGHRVSGSQITRSTYHQGYHHPGFGSPGSPYTQVTKHPGQDHRPGLNLSTRVMGQTTHPWSSPNAQGQAHKPGSRVEPRVKPTHPGSKPMVKPLAQGQDHRPGSRVRV